MVIWAEPAKSDLRAIHDFIASNTKYYAKKVARDIVEKQTFSKNTQGLAERCRRLTMKTYGKFLHTHTGSCTKSNQTKFTS
jgi:hypothetical protein